MKHCARANQPITEVMELWIGAEGNVESCAHLRCQPVWVSADFQISDVREPCGRITI